MARKILVFGAGDHHQMLIRACKNLGYFTIVTDPQEKTLFGHLADKFVVLAPDDYDGHRRLIREEGIEGLATCAMETPLMMMAKLAEEFGLIFPSSEVILHARNKYLMKQRFLEHGVPCARGIRVRSREELEEIDFSHWAFPLIIKPVDAYSSRGVFRALNKEELFAYYPETRKFSSGGDVLVEEFLEGPEVSVESITFQGKTTVIQITDHIITPYPRTVELEHYQPSYLPDSVHRQIKEVVIKAHQAIGIDNSGSHAELKITAQGPKMLEIASRLGSDHMSSYLPLLSTGVDMNQAIAQVAMGEAPDLEVKHRQFSGIRYYTWEPGKRVKKTFPIDQLLRNPLVTHAALKVQEGDILPEITESSKRHAYFITCGDTKDQLLQRMDLLTEEISKLVVVE